MIDCDLHIHSNYSFDCLMRPGGVVRSAQLRDLSVISITDHGTMQVYRNELTEDSRKRIFDEHGVFIVKGMEINTDAGDVIGLFLEEEVTATAFTDTVEEIRTQGGIVVLPHPFHRDADPRAIVDQVDVLETVNGRCRPVRNRKAVALAERTGTPALGGSDAHMYWEVGRIRTSFERSSIDEWDATGLRSLLLDGDRSARGSPLPYFLTHGVSYASSRVSNVRERVGE